MKKIALIEGGKSRKKLVIVVVLLTNVDILNMFKTYNFQKLLKNYKKIFNKFIKKIYEKIIGNLLKTNIKKNY